VLLLLLLLLPVVAVSAASSATPAVLATTAMVVVATDSSSRLRFLPQMFSFRARPMIDSSLSTCIPSQHSNHFQYISSFVLLLRST